MDPETIKRAAVDEFDSAVDTLRNAGIDVHVIDDTPEPVKTDAVFPNNWISFHEDGTIVTYPMCSSGRRQEIRRDILDYFRESFEVREVWPLQQEVSGHRFLEGTGSMVLDHANNILYACRSVRTNEELLRQFAGKFNYRPVVFDASDDSGLPIYHTNVIMAVCRSLAVVCLEAVRDRKERECVEQQLRDSGKELVEISVEQVTQYCGNLLQLARLNNRPIIVMSTTAQAAFTESQSGRLEVESEIIPIAIPMIETYGGGSARCMIAEIFLKPPVN